MACDNTNKTVDYNHNNCIIKRLSFDLNHLTSEFRNLYDIGNYQSQTYGKSSEQQTTTFQWNINLPLFDYLLCSILW